MSEILSRDEIETGLRLVGKKYDVPVFYLFGSYARNEAGPDSDIDLVVDSRNIRGLLKFETVRQEIEGVLGKPVDMIPEHSIEEEKNLPWRQEFTRNYYEDRVRIDV